MNHRSRFLLVAGIITIAGTLTLTQRGTTEGPDTAIQAPKISTDQAGTPDYLRTTSARKTSRSCLLNSLAWNRRVRFQPMPTTTWSRMKTCATCLIFTWPTWIVNPWTWFSTVSEQRWRTG